ncbi:hypothetical protein FQA39_LY18396 [Lamprigera yunnana]|nr:hypothetical protein FQA39_LY18396 [Lamprigera yunnana]
MDVSIIVPIYNGELYINRCFQSIINQTAITQLKIEVCVCNDASIDNTKTLLAEWSQRLCDKNVHLLVYENKTKKPRGVGYSKNKAVMISRGEYLCFQDVDDVMLPNRVLNQYQRAVLEPKNTIVGSKFERLPLNSTVRYTAWANNVTNLEMQIYTSHGPTIIMPTWFCHRFAFDKINGFVEYGTGTPEDLIFFYKHLDYGGRLCRVNEVLLTYYYNPNAATFSIHENTIWNLRLERLQREVLSKWLEFTIWNAGKQGRKFYRSLTKENKCKVKAMCDVDVNLIGKTYAPYDPKTRTVERAINIITFRNAIPPIIICVKMDLTNGEFERNLKSLNLIEDKDYVYFS